MTKPVDFTAMMKDMMAAFPVNTTAFEDAFKSTAALNEKLTSVALEAAEKSAEISNTWTQDALSKLSEASKVKAEPADYAKAMSALASSSAETATEKMAAFAEIAKKVQMDTVELMMAAGKELSDEASAVVKKATDDATAVVKKAAPAKKAAAKA